jgi:hypothetical protein
MLPYSSTAGKASRVNIDNNASRIVGDATLPPWPNWCSRIASIARTRSGDRGGPAVAGIPAIDRPAGGDPLGDDPPGRCALERRRGEFGISGSVGHSRDPGAGQSVRTAGHDAHSAGGARRTLITGISLSLSHLAVPLGLAATSDWR